MSKIKWGGKEHLEFLNKHSKELKCKYCRKKIPDILASWEDEYCSEDCYELDIGKEHGVEEF